MKKDFLDEMQLPQGNSKEELETISANLFRPKFEVTLFEFAQVIARDKGIDFSIEIKRNNSHTNFRFHVQLKATEKIERNKDGTVSLKIYTSNINYLQNSGSTAYYVLYFKRENVFLFANVNDFVNTLSL